MEFTYFLKPEIVFGRNKLDALGDLCAQRGWENGILVCDPMFVENGLAARVKEVSAGRIASIFSDITANPTVDSVDACVRQIEAEKAAFVVALGGGSSMDCAKAASVTAGTGRSVRDFHSGGCKPEGAGLPIVAIPTTAGTGSEVTNVAVLSDPEKGIKGPMACDAMYVKLALVDPVLTVSVPPRVTASTGLDVLSHALEGYWSKQHQPICDACAIYAAKLVFDNLYQAYQHGDDLDAREQMCAASLIAGLAFAHPKTAASHACSFPLTNVYHIPHGEACAFTLDALVAINCETDRARLATFAKMVGFSDPEAMAEEIRRLKKEMGMKCTLADAGIAPEDVPALAEKCMHPNLLNNPTPLSAQRVADLFMQLQ